jgi:hypothetical protein
VKDVELKDLRSKQVDLAVLSQRFKRYYQPASRSLHMFAIVCTNCILVVFMFFAYYF